MSRVIFSSAELRLNLVENSDINFFVKLSLS